MSLYLMRWWDVKKVFIRISCSCKLVNYKQQPTELEMEVELNCSHCSNEYSDDNPPRMLINCGHTFCERCLSQLALFNQLKLSICCPEDQKVTEFAGNVQSLPKNITLMKYLDARQKNNSLSFKDDSSFDMSKITKSEQFQEDEDAKELIIAIDGKEYTEKIEISKDVPLKSEDLTQPESDSLLTDKVEVEMCLLHQRPIEVVCLNDHQRLCSKCAIFGQHKGHDFRSLDEIDNLNKKYYSQIIAVFEEKEHIQHRIDKHITEKELIQILAVKGSKVKKEIADKFKKMADQLVKTEKLAYKKLEEMMSTMEKKLKHLLVLDEKIRSALSTWESTSLIKINLNETHSHQGTLNFYLEGKDIIAAGKDILNKLKNYEEKAISQAGRFIEDMGVSFNQGNFITALHNMVDIYESQYERKSFFAPPAPCASRYKENEKFLANREQLQQIKKPAKLQMLHQNDESLLEFDEFQDSKSTISMIASRVLEDSFVKMEVQKEEETVMASVLNMSKQVYPQKLQKKKTNPLAVSKDLDKSKDMSQTQASLSSGLGKEAIKKKLRSLKIPEKYEKMMEGVMTDTLDTVDFTNAELGDNTVIQICDLMKKNTRVKTLKLIRNKLTDEGLGKILPFMTGISTLNLSQNLLTQQSLNFITDLRSSLPQLKAVILSQNKILERKSKTVIEKLRKMDLTVSI